VDRRDFQQLSRIRAREAEALLKLGLSDGAYYLAGYAVECALKACIAKGTRRYEFPDKKRPKEVTSTNWTN
jgi:HEPN domain-containing protein